MAKTERGGAGVMLFGGVFISYITWRC